jgi:hypothetical protein
VSKKLLTPEQQRVMRLEEDAAHARKCLNECPFRGGFQRYLEAHYERIRKILMEPSLQNLNDINYARGALAVILEPLNIPKRILEIEQELVANQLIQLKKTEKAKVKKKEIDV